MLKKAVLDHLSFAMWWITLLELSMQKRSRVWDGHGQQHYPGSLGH